MLKGTWCMNVFKRRQRELLALLATSASSNVVAAGLALKGDLPLGTDGRKRLKAKGAGTMAGHLRKAARLGMDMLQVISSATQLEQVAAEDHAWHWACNAQNIGKLTQSLLS